MSLAENIKNIRKSRGLTQAQLADRVGVVKATVSSWETGRTEPNMEMIESIASVLSCNKSDLVGKDRIDGIQILNAEGLSRENFNRLKMYYEFLLQIEGRDRDVES